MSDPKVQYFTFDEVKEHNSRQNLWLVLHGKVYNVSSFVEDVLSLHDLLVVTAM